MTLPRSIIPLLSAMALTAGVATTLAIAPAVAQEAKPEVVDTLNAAKRTQPNLRFSIDRRTGLPTRLRNLNVPTNFVRSLGATKKDDKPPSEEAIKRYKELINDFSKWILSNSSSENLTSICSILMIFMQSLGF